jgi:hypothetical protein
VDQHKIDNFLKAYPGVAFPTYVHLDATHASAIRGVIAKSIDLPDADGLAIVDKVRAISVETTGFQPDESAFSVGGLLRELGVKSPEKVYLNWYRFYDIDLISLADLDQFFSDIWYPGSDDLDVFDESAAWIVSIAHYGKVTHFRR